MLIKQPARLMGWLFCMAWLGCLGGPVWAAAPDDQRLEEVRSEITRKKVNLAQQKKAIAKINKALKQDELNIAKVAKTLRKRRLQLANTQREQAELKTQQTQLKNQLGMQQQALASQLRSAYLAGQHDYIKLLMSQQEPGRLERTLNYYQYLNKARINSIDTLVATATALENVEARLQTLAAQHTEQIKQQEQEQQTLARSKRKREASRQSLQALLGSEQARLNQLQQSEAQLATLITHSQSPTITLAGLKQHRGSIERPLKGPIRHRYGTRRQGGVRWKGVYIDGRSGSDIHAVHQGKVLYSDWVKSMGLVLILDHGEGYMSLYAHAQALLKEVGDSVSQGETIALVGQSGGQSRPGLYFELRHKGEPVNPSKWFKH